MNRVLKLLAVLFGIIAVLVVVVLVAAKILITPERVRAEVIPRAESALNRPVSIGDIHVNIFSGISIKNFLVKTPDGRDTFVAADALVLRYRFWPLLRMRVVLDEARLENPTIRVVRFKNGEFNFSDLLKSKNESKPAKPQPASPPKSGPPIDLMVNQMRISGGNLKYIDQSAGQGPHTYQVSNLDLSADKISLNRAFPFSFEMRLNGAPIAITGSFNPKILSGNAHITADQIDVNQFSPYLAGRIPGKLESMKLDLDIRVDRKGDVVTSSGNIRAGRIDLVLDAMPDKPLRNARVGLTYDAAVDTGTETIRINKADVDINGIPVKLSGAVSEYGTRPVLDLQADLPPTGAPTFLAALPQGMAAQANQMNPEGRISADIHLAGSPRQVKTLVRQGQIRLDGVGATYNGLQAAINGRLDIKGDAITGKQIAIGIEKQQAMLDFEVAGLTGKPIRITHTLTSNTLNLDKITAALGGEKKAPPEKKQPGKTGPAPPSGPMNLPLTADGTVEVGSAVYRGLNVKNFNLLYRLENNILQVRRLSGEVAGGTLSGKGKINLGVKKIDYEADVSVKGTKADDLVSALFPAAAHTMFGSLFLNAGLSGRGLELSGIRQTLTGQADLKVTDGKITGTELTRGLASFLGANTLQVLNFKAVEGNVRLNNGKFAIHTDYNSNDLRMSPTGTIGLDGSLDLSLNMRLAPALASRINRNPTVARLLTDDQGWTLLPLNVAGSVSSPRFALDTSAIKEQLKERGTRELRQRIEEKLFKKPAPSKEGETPPDQQKQPPVDKLLEDTLKRIF